MLWGLQKLEKSKEIFNNGDAWLTENEKEMKKKVFYRFVIDQPVLVLQSIIKTPLKDW